MPLGIFVGTLFVGLAAIAPSFPLAFAAVVVSGLGVAAFHPEGSRYANYLSGARRATGMSLFSLGGNAGFALGPGPGDARRRCCSGSPGALLVAIPGALVALWIAAELPRLRSFQPEKGAMRARLARRRR